MTPLRIHRSAAVALLTLPLLALGPGCANDECTRDSDCDGKGEGLICQSAQCIQAVEVEVDAGTDAGKPDGGKPDAGAPDAGKPDAGSGCQRTGCDAGYGCAPAMDGGAPTCEPLWIALTTGTTSAPNATLVRFNDPSARVEVGPASAGRQPRFSGQGDRLAYLSMASDGGRELRVVTLPPAPRDLGAPIISSIAAGTDDFPQLEYAPGSALLWTKRLGGSTSGVFWVPESGGVATQAAVTGGYADWAPDGGRVACSNATGVMTVNRDGTDPLTVAGGGIEPMYQPSGRLILFRRGAGFQPDFDEELFTVPVGGGAENRLTTATPADGGSGTYASLASWSGTGDLIAFVRVHWVYDSGLPALCSSSTCGTRPPQEVMLLKVDPVTGAADGAPMSLGAGTQPSLSPDGRYLAYVVGSQLRIQELDAAGNPTGINFVHPLGAIVTGGGDDARPRWQPKR